MAADVIDQACDFEAAFTAASLAVAVSRNKPEQVQNDDGTWPVTECVDCGDDIPHVRLFMGRIRCVYCQGKKEQRGKGYAQTG